MAVYLITTPTSKHLVEARTQGQALNHVLKKTTTVKTLSTGEMSKLIREGMAIEEAAAEDTPAAAGAPTPLEQSIADKQKDAAANAEAADLAAPKFEGSSKNVIEPKEPEAKKSPLNLGSLRKKG